MSFAALAFSAKSGSAKSGPAKSAEAFRTISEVAGELDVPQHVLRFWESRFAQIKPVKRAGGRRYYRPEDIDLLKGIRALLYSDGFTIKGVQKLLKERGLRHVAGAWRGGEPAPQPVVIEKIVYVEKPVPAKKRHNHLRAVPDISLPFFDAPAQPHPALLAAYPQAPVAQTVVETVPVMMPQDDAPADVSDREMLEDLLVELSALKARLQAFHAAK